MLPATSTSRRKYRRDELAMLMKERKYADGSGSSRRSDECANTRLPNSSPNDYLSGLLLA